MAVASYRGLLANRNFLRVFTAGIGSIAGSSLAGVCIIWIVAVDTRSALDVALVGTAEVVSAIVFSTLGGTLVDRYDRRRLMILSDVVRAVALGILVLDLVRYGLDLPLLLTVAGLVAAFSVVFNPAEQAIVPALVGPEHVADANGLVRSSRSSVQFAGVAAAGALIVSVGANWGIAANSITFAISALLLTGLRLRPSAPTGDGGVRAGYWSDLRQGFRWLWQAQGFFQLTLSAMFFNFSAALVGTFLVFFATDLLHGSALVFAALLAAQVAGQAMGSLLVGRVGAVRYAGKAWVVPYGVASGLVALGLALVVTPSVDIAALFALGFLGGFAGTAWLTAAQLLVPSDMQGRYFGIDQLGSVAILPTAQIGGAFLIYAVAVRETYLIAAVLWIVSGVAFLFAPALWRLGVAPGESLTSRTDVVEAETPGSPAGTRRG